MKNIIYIAILFILFQHGIIAQNKDVNGTAIGANKTDVISKPCAIIINPTDKQLKEMGNTNGKEDIQTVNDNANLSIGIIKSYLDSTNTLTIEKEAKGELKFKLINGKTYNLNIEKLYWNVFLFNGENTPIKATVLDFSRQYINYMKIEK